MVLAPADPFVFKPHEYGRSLVVGKSTFGAHPHFTAMIISQTTAKLKEWQNNLSANDGLPIITTSAIIKISELEDYIKQIKPAADSVSVNLIRFTWNSDEPQGKKRGPNAQVFAGCEWNVVKNGKTQVAIAISPGKYAEDKDLVASSVDIVNNGKVLLLIPGGEKEGPTGHNPPSGKSSGRP